MTTASRACLIMIDGEGDLSDVKQEARTKAVENHKKWVDAAAALGCHAIRVNTGESLQPDRGGADRRGLRPADGLRREERDQDHLRESWWAVEQPGRDDRA